MTGIGSTTTLTVNGAAEQLLIVGITLYAAVTIDEVVLVRRSLMLDCPVPEAPPLKPVPEGAAHAKVVPAGTTVPVGV